MNKELPQPSDITQSGQSNNIDGGNRQFVRECFPQILFEDALFSQILTELITTESRNNIETADILIRQAAIKQLYDLSKCCASLGTDTVLKPGAVNFRLPAVPSQVFIDTGIVNNPKTIRQIRKRQEEKRTRGGGESENCAVISVLDEKELLSEENARYLTEERLTDTYNYDEWRTHPGMDLWKFKVKPIVKPPFLPKTSLAGLQGPYLLVDEHFTKSLPDRKGLEVGVSGHYLFAKDQTGKPILFFLEEEHGMPHLHLLSEIGTHFRIDATTHPDGMKRELEGLEMPSLMEPREDHIATNEQIASLLVLFRYSIPEQ